MIGNKKKKEEIEDITEDGKNQATPDWTPDDVLRSAALNYKAVAKAQTKEHDSTVK